MKDLAKAVESNEIAASVKVTINLKKPKSDKATESKQLSYAGQGESSSLKTYYSIKIILQQ